MKNDEHKTLSRIQNEKGSLFILSYFILIIIIALGAAYLLLSTNESRTALKQQATVQAFHIAEAGIERALYDLGRDSVPGSPPNWADGDINGVCSHPPDYTPCGPSTTSFYELTYCTEAEGTAWYCPFTTTHNGGTYLVELKNDDTDGRKVWVRSTGTLNGITQTILMYLQVDYTTIWDNAIFAGVGSDDGLINGNVDVRGSVHILGNGLEEGDFAVELSGNALMAGNNYEGISASLLDRVPGLEEVIFEGETVETLHAEFRVKHGKVSLGGSSGIGEADEKEVNSVKETLDGYFVTDETVGASSVHSDNGTANPYDMGETVSFPSLSDPYEGYATYQAYLKANALVLTDELDNIKPNSTFEYPPGGGTNSISMDGNGNMTISGIVYIDEDNDLAMNKQGSNKTITYTGTGSLLVTGEAKINVSLVTPTAPGSLTSYPDNIIGIMTPNEIEFDSSQIDVMGLFYAEDEIEISKQTEIFGTVVSNYFDIGSQVPNIYQVPEVVNNLPPGMIGGESGWRMRIVSWQKI
jgi:type II secretory pathway pseudopilin PulG